MNDVEAYMVTLVVDKDRLEKLEAAIDLMIEMVAQASGLDPSALQEGWKAPRDRFVRDIQAGGTEGLITPRPPGWGQ